MRNNFGRDNKYRTLCCHVKSATLAWGFLNVILQFIVLASFIMVLINPKFTTIKHNDLSSVLDVNFKSDATLSSFFNDDKDDIFQVKQPKSREQLFSIKIHDFNIDAHIGLIVTLCAFLLTWLLIHGVLAGKPGYLIPFFSLQIFDLCLTVLTFLGFYTYSPNMKKYIYSDVNKNLPFQDDFMKMNSNYLSITTFILFLAIVTFKMYFIHVVWSCYKYLCGRKSGMNINYIKVEPETSSLPDYETAVKMAPTDFIIPPVPINTN
ncbi:lysosomal-associated transmembrane protein 4B-like isoform X2 [Gordionus sp. m RMFG-2023]|uniref:lysosomal-associated transmembrane protein 4B-like isoform X2 n=1 Tax=Gordionus sp. m RMFG-2023 TaxID=3053472 RepID=UPI0031FD489F